VRITSDQNYIISGSRDKSIKIFDIKSKKQVHHFKSVREGVISSIAVTPDGNLMICGYGNKSIKIFDINTTHKLNHFREVHQGLITDL